MAGLLYCSLKKWPFFPPSPKNKAMQRNTNGTAMTWAVTCRSDLRDEISSYSYSCSGFLPSFVLRFLPGVLIITSEKQATRESVKTIFLPGK